MRHRNISLRNPPVEKNNDACAKRDNSRKKPKRLNKYVLDETVNYVSVAIVSLVRLVCFIMEFPHCSHACVLAGAAMLVRALCKGLAWKFVRCAVLQRNEMS